MGVPVVLALISTYLTTWALTGAIGETDDLMHPKCRALVIQAEHAIYAEDDTTRRTIKWPYRCTYWKR